MLDLNANPIIMGLIVMSARWSIAGTPRPEPTLGVLTRYYREFGLGLLLFLGGKTMKKINIVEPDDSVEFQHILRGEFNRIGLPKEDADWLSKVMGGPLFADPDSDSETVGLEDPHEAANFLCEAMERLREEPADQSRSAFHVRLLHYLLGFGPGSSITLSEVVPPYLDDGSVATWVNLWLERPGIDWSEALKVLLVKDPHILQKEFLTLLVQLLGDRSGDVFESVDFGNLSKVVRRIPPHYFDHENQPERVEFWLHRFMDRYGESGVGIAFDHLFPRFRTLDDDELGPVAIGLHASTVWGIFRGDGKVRENTELSTAWKASLRPYFDEIGARMDGSGHTPALQEAWMQYGIRLNEVGLLTTAERDALTTAAQKQLAWLRAYLRDTPKDVVKLDWEPASRAVMVLKELHGTWKALKPLLLLLSVLPQQATARDLRYWNEPGREDDLPPDPWYNVPNMVAFLFRELRAEQEEDPGLLELRTHFVEYILERLKTRKGTQPGTELTNEHMVETRPEWRYFYVRAVRELKLNPRGRVHRTLHWVSRNDPEEQVRNAARAAYKELRREPGLIDGLSPRRPLFAAFWWLRQAHLNEVGVAIDRKGAQRTRAKEVTRIEKEGY